MKIQYFKSLICPRCYPTDVALRKLHKEFGNKIEIEKIELISNYSRFKKEKVKNIPSLKIGEDLLSGQFLSYELVRSFVLKHLKPEEVL